MKILVLANFGMGLYNFRKELLEELIKQDNEVYISLPDDEYVPKLKKVGCKFIDTNLERRGTNPRTDFKLLLDYVGIIKEIKPDVVLTYTIKPNVYGGIACAITKTPFITNITGLGTSIENKGLIQKITLMLYKLSLRKASCVFFQNQSNRKFFEDNKIVKSKTRLIPGSGVNLRQHKFEEYPIRDEKVRFLFIGRIMKAKGIEELFKAAKMVKDNFPNVQFDLIGSTEENYNEEIDKLEKQDIIKYHGQQNDVHSFIKKSHAIILPSYHEGLANVLLESASSGRPVLASRVPGCVETFEDGLTGFGFEVMNVESLVKAILKFINLPYDQKREMGMAGRRKMEIEFNRNIVINDYLQEINKIMDKENQNEFIREIS
ncbi:MULTISPECIES: glycosyltransferase family 4 protein [unclassified Bacillus (in: firmicutes)]|uniref:glycosyltransferase family 4 protein n=1 Tax=unclassified Bacillus (in: firmicutes) TaxID=185979 RepID=UPI0008E47875|nr:MULTISPECIES: glycosyltransferase family 4 protein [unclassified Bacillus (in: firmicutes)]SFB04670.1 galacturonosyltransferase [Bacillus sp. UNCCL13]SFQ88446.1 galacturonosyltransferase [Bacillus sp. cl95]